MKKRLLLLLLLSLFLLGLCGCSGKASERSYSGKELFKKCKLQGRCALTDKGISLDWSCSGIEFVANCSGNVTVAVTPTALSSSDAAGGCFFTVIVDGEVMYGDRRMPELTDASLWTENSTGYPYCFYSMEEVSFTVAEGLPSGKHTFEIYKQTEAVEGAFAVSGITLTGSLCEAPEEKDTYIEFVGDSIIAGYGDLTSGEGRTALYQDSTRGFPYLTCKKLNADWSLICRSGITATNGIGWDGADSVSMQQVYPLLSRFSDTKTEYNFTRQPDAVVVSLGANDLFTYSDCGADRLTVEEGMLSAARLLREKNPKAKLVWITGTTEPGLDLLVESLAYDMGGEEKGFYTLSLPADSSGGHGHPGLSAQSQYAEILAEFLRKIL